MQNIILKSDSVKNAQGKYDVDAFPSDLPEGCPLDLNQLREGMEINILELSKEQVVFDLIGTDAPIANALRRIMIAEVPTMAIEFVSINQNTSVIQDEVLSHRLGLIPIKADPAKFDFIPEPPFDDDQDKYVYTPTSNTVLRFQLFVQCKRENGQIVNENVYSSALKWVPLSGQQDMFDEPDLPAPVEGNILIAKLRPGQHIDLICDCVKGIGREHAKWSPVCTASYRLLPNISINAKYFVNKLADKLVKVCPMNVFDIEELGNARHAVVARPRNCTACRECIRDPEWNKMITIGRNRNHFIFSVESTGVLLPENIVTQAIFILKDKIKLLLDEIQ